jgi:hypothetical protein
VTEPELPAIEGKLLRVFPEDLPKDELNTKIDELFVPAATNDLPATADAFLSWRATQMAELRRIVLRSLPEKFTPQTEAKLSSRKEQTGTLLTERGVSIPWKYFPASNTKSDRALWLVVLGEEESLDSKPEWLIQVAGEAPAFLIAPRGSGPLRVADPAPYYIQRSLALLGRTLDSCQLNDVLAATAQGLQNRRSGSPVKIVGRGRAGIIAAYAALLEPRVSEVVVIDPPTSHRDGPIFLNVLRVLDVPEALGLLAPRPLTIHTTQADAFQRTASIYRVAGGTLKLESRP